MQAGKISYAEFERAEAKRAANRLRDQWKKDPWVPGCTIDLGEHEMAFQGDLLHWVGALVLPPAVMDWLRWRYRRLQIDRSMDDVWTLLLRDEVPRRMRDAGPAPAGWQPVEPGHLAPWRVDASGPVGHKRARVDRPRALRTSPRGRLSALANAPHADPAEVARIVSASADTLGPLLPLCANDEERSQLVAALVEYVRNPVSARAREAWASAVAELRRR